jgi:hypothetical protein
VETEIGIGTWGLEKNYIGGIVGSIGLYYNEVDLLLVKI